MMSIIVSYQPLFARRCIARRCIVDFVVTDFDLLFFELTLMMLICIQSILVFLFLFCRGVRANVGECICRPVRVARTAAVRVVTAKASPPKRFDNNVKKECTERPAKRAISRRLGLCQNLCVAVRRKLIFSRKFTFVVSAVLLFRCGFLATLPRHSLNISGLLKRRSTYSSQKRRKQITFILRCVDVGLCWICFYILCFEAHFRMPTKKRLSEMMKRLWRYGIGEVCCRPTSTNGLVAHTQYAFKDKTRVAGPWMSRGMQMM